MRAQRIGPEFYGLLLIVGFVTFALHEGGHWLAATLLGHDAFYGLNGAGTRADISRTDLLIVTAAGPAVTVLQGLVAFALTRARHGLTAFAFLYFAAFMRLMALGISFLHLNDEARISQMLGWGAFTLPAVVAGVLVVLTVMAGRALRLSWRTWLFSWLAASATVALIVWLDAALKG